MRTLEPSIVGVRTSAFRLPFAVDVEALGLARPRIDVGQVVETMNRRLRRITDLAVFYGGLALFHGLDQRGLLDAAPYDFR